MTDARRLSQALRQHVDGLRPFGVMELPARDAALHRKVLPTEQKISGDKATLLAELALEVEKCRGCALYRTRTHPVISDGTPDARLLFVGEAPGHEEDLQGTPFVGAAGQLLNRMIAAIGLRREDVYICNVLKDRPPANRTPEPDEMRACAPFLMRQIAIVRPKIICALGAVAAKALLGPSVSIMRVRGQLHALGEIPLVPTFHPAYLLRNPSAKREAWVDLQLIRRLLAE